MTAPSRRIAPLVLLAAVIAALVAGYAYVLHRDQQVCAGELCVLSVAGRGLVLAKQMPAGKLEVVPGLARHYSNAITERAVRFEWDFEGDGIWDCREDDCDGEASSGSRYCVSRFGDGKWTRQPSGQYECSSAYR